MRWNRVVVCAGLWCGVLAPGVAAPITITLEQAVAAAEPQVRGTPFAVSLTECDGRRAWQTRLLGADGRIHQVMVDAVTGKALQASIIEHDAEYERQPPRLPVIPLRDALRAATASLPGEPVGIVSVPDGERAQWKVMIEDRRDRCVRLVAVGGVPARALAIDGTAPSTPVLRLPAVSTRLPRPTAPVVSRFHAPFRLGDGVNVRGST